MTNNLNVKLEQVSERVIQISDGGPFAVFCVRNEVFRLPYFLDYYRRLGVTSFLAIDNNSSDGTREFLLQQEDVHLFHTSQSYKSGNAGRDWTHYLASTYGTGFWGLTLDVDEFFLFPNCEHSSLHGLTEYLDLYGYEGVFSIFLDFYSDRPLSETHYREGSSPFEVCKFFDSPDAYTCYEREIFPHFEIKGGPRRRIFWPGSSSREGPSMRKLVLVKWRKGFSYSHSTHSCTPIKLADISGVVAHFKFLSHFKDYARDEVLRNARIANSVDWKVYANTLEKVDPIFFDQDISLSFESSQSLLNAQLMRNTSRFQSFLQEKQQQERKLGPSSLTPKSESTSFSLSDRTFENQHSSFRELCSLWPAISAYSQEHTIDARDKQILARFEKDMETAASSVVWRSSYFLRKWASSLGLTDQRSLTEENFYNQSIHARFTFTYKSIWWDVLAPFRIIQKLVRRVRRKSN